MHFITSNRFPYRAPTLCLAVLTAAFAAPAANAQDLNLSSGSYTANDFMYQKGTIQVGRDSKFSATDGNRNPYAATLKVVAGGSVYFAQCWNSSTLNISGGSVNNARGFDTFTLNISGGSVFIADGYDTGTVNISGGSVKKANGFGISTTNISGGSVGDFYAYNASKVTISGGSVTRGVVIHDTKATANFVGTDFSFVYNGYGNNTPYGTYFYADSFIVTGTVGGSANTSYNVYIRNEAGAGGIANSTPRQFLFNGVAPAVVTKSKNDHAGFARVQ